MSAFFGGKLLHISFLWGGVPKVSELEPIFNQASDWLRYAPNCWIVWTALDVNTWSSRLLPQVTVNDRLFICEIKPPAFQGWMEVWVWNWLNKPRTPPRPGT